MNPGFRYPSAPNYLNQIRFGIACLLMICSIVSYAQTTHLSATENHGNSPFYNTEAIVSLVFRDTLFIPSFTEFDLPVRMKTGNEVSAISLGFYFPDDYLEVTGMELANGTSGFTYSVQDGFFKMAWSSLTPLTIPDDGTLVTLNMSSFDLAGLSGTIRLEVDTLSEFADPSATVIEGIVLETAEIGYLSPGPVDTLGGNYVRVYPNPFDEVLSVSFYLEEESRVKISIHNLAGVKVRQVTDSDFSEGSHEVRIFASDLSKSVYLLRFELSNPQLSGSKLFKIMPLR